MLTISQIQRQMVPWCNHNFPDVETVDPLLGVVEEVGELAHAFLKGKQKIRGDQSGKVRDAVGDIVIFLMHFCLLHGLDLEAVVNETWQEVRQRDWRTNPTNGVTQ